MSEATLKINEIFFSIQGESLFAGKPTLFVRTAACNLRCTYCDTRYAFWHGTVMSVSNIMEEVRKAKTRWVCLTGGEPLGQQGIYPLMEALLAENYVVSLETNGSFSVANVPEEVVKVIDLKCPDSGEEDQMDWGNCAMVKPQDQFKFVIASHSDFLWAQSICKEHALASRCHILFSPVSGKVKPSDLAAWILSEGAEVTMQLQMHKTIWGPESRGV
jgi:7-carboxy-7-deazaguanine synthase